MRADKAAMEWVQGWQEKGPAPQKMGFIYMLKGDAVPIPTRRMRLPITGPPRHDRGSCRGYDARPPEGFEARLNQTLRHVARPLRLHWRGLRKESRHVVFNSCW
jgi:hypothetical protein